VTDFKKILVSSSCVAGLYLASLYFFPHNEVRSSAILNRIVLIILFFLALFLFLREPRKSNRFIFINFSLAFLISIINLISEFFGVAFFNDNRFASFIYWQYSTITFLFFLSLSIGYLVVDSLFYQRKAYQKYIAILTVLLLFFGYYFYPILKDPLGVYKTENIKQWKALDKYIEGSPTATSFQESGDLEQLAIELSNNVRLQSWKDGIPIGDLYPDQNYSRIKELIPYLAGNTYQILVVAPIYVDMVQLNILLVALIILFFGYQYTMDPPQGAYIDKIMFVLLLFCSMEILHNWAFIKSLEWSTWNDLFSIGQYVTICIELVLVLFFSLRLNFITSIHGEFYEKELALHPSQITRWRDWIDNLILANFFSLKRINGRLFQDPSAH
jgi:hypothetical protein